MIFKWFHFLNCAVPISFFLYFIFACIASSLAILALPLRFCHPLRFLHNPQPIKREKAHFHFTNETIANDERNKSMTSYAIYTKLIKSPYLDIDRAKSIAFCQPRRLVDFLSIYLAFVWLLRYFLPISSFHSLFLYFSLFLSLYPLPPPPFSLFLSLSTLALFISLSLVEMEREESNISLNISSHSASSNRFYSKLMDVQSHPSTNRIY